MKEKEDRAGLKNVGSGAKSSAFKHWLILFNLGQSLNSPVT